MKYSPENYARALIEELQKTESVQSNELVKNFVSQIIRNGDFLSVDKILQRVEIESTKVLGGKNIEIEFARVVDKRLVEELSGVFTKQDMVNIKINPSLVAGVRITIDGEKELDNSIAKKVREIFSK